MWVVVLVVVWVVAIAIVAVVVIGGDSGDGCGDGGNSESDLVSGRYRYGVLAYLLIRHSRARELLEHRVSSGVELLATPVSVRWCNSSSPCC